MLSKANEYIEKYLSFDRDGNKIATFIKELGHLRPEFTTMPVCVMSYDFSKKRAKFLNYILKHKMTIARDYYIFTNEKNAHQYIDLLEYSDKIKIIIVDEAIDNLVGKRNYIIDFAKEMNFSDYFVIEDDAYYFALLYKEPNKIFNTKLRNVDVEVVFNVWEAVIKLTGLKYTGIYYEGSGTAGTFKEDQFFKLNFSFTHCFHMNTSSNFHYNEISECGWDDFDFTLQHCLSKNKNEHPHVITLFCHQTPDFISISDTYNTTNDVGTYYEDLVAKSKIFYKKWDRLVKFSKNAKNIENYRPNTPLLKKLITGNYNVEHYWKTGQMIKNE